MGKKLEAHLENERQVVRDVMWIPWWSTRAHLNHDTPYTPHITRPSIALSPQYLSWESTHQQPCITWAKHNHNASYTLHIPHPSIALSPQYLSWELTHQLPCVKTQSWCIPYSTHHTPIYSSLPTIPVMRTDTPTTMCQNTIMIHPILYTSLTHL